MRRFDPNEQFRISQISLSGNDKHLIVATSQDARQNKRQSRCHPKHETVYGGSCAKGRSVTFETHGLAYAKKLEHNTSHHTAVLWVACTGARLRREMGRHPNISWERGCLYMLEILLLNIVGMPVCSTDGWKQ